MLRFGWFTPGYKRGRNREKRFGTDLTFGVRSREFEFTITPVLRNIKEVRDGICRCQIEGKKQKEFKEGKKRKTVARDRKEIVCGRILVEIGK